ncbi:ribonucleotide-diphosphate reductase subunit beta [Bacillus subtilis]|uniref:ribonucleotide-diphosphate reductase subunit beta n=1 Tax=Bacillus subtilis TaxID=1423 RepID=UPI0025A177F7|nr:ribonucleotide-diphosphate reductase subunit beta [Bacillus subtilis]MDM5455683.1 ribonucleotide-diphosphate reductase subunit beta [Bacillus subtilis]MDW4547491.1 ribonucleotide-diphosphate reductase subunit beta [Bacillus subtilis subsp. subtilis]
MEQLTKQVRVFNENLPNKGERMFDDVSGILFWDDIINQVYYELIKEMREVFWIPDEVSMSKDKVQWATEMNEMEQELFLNAIGILAVLDSIATYFDNVAAYYIRDSAIKALMAFVAAMETIHNESYTYILSSVSSKAVSLDVFERPKKNEFMIRRNKLMMDLFDEFIQNPTPETFAKGLVAMSGLEGLCFVNGFTPFYHFNRNGKMFGTGTVIQYIQRDEMKHSYFQTILVRDILTQYPELNTEEFSEFVYDFFTKLVQLEREFCEDLYKNTPDIDIEEVKEYIGYRANLILDNLGLDQIFAVKKNPMPWITAFDPDNLNNTKRDFFEDKEVNYGKANEQKNDWDDL